MFENHPIRGVHFKKDRQLGDFLGILEISKKRGYAESR